MSPHRALPHQFVASAQQWGKECPIGDPNHRAAHPAGLARRPKSRHGSAMLRISPFVRAISFAVMALLVSASTVLPSASYAQKYADHLSQYGGIDARTAAITGFAALYVNPEAARLPVVLVSVLTDAEQPCLPTSCSVEKSVLTKAAATLTPQTVGPDRDSAATYPQGVERAALHGPPRYARAA